MSSEKHIPPCKAMNPIAEIAVAETTEKTTKKTMSVMKSMPDITLAELVNSTGLSVEGKRK